MGEMRHVVKNAERETRKTRNEAQGMYKESSGQDEGKAERGSRATHLGRELLEFLNPIVQHAQRTNDQ